MNPRGRKPEKDVPFLHAFCRDDLALFNNADGKARDIILAFGIKAMHLRRFAADERTARCLAGTRDPFDDCCDLLGDEFPDSEVIEEIERLRSLDENVVDTHGDSVLPNRIVLIEKKGKAELRTDAVCTGDEDRFLVLSGVQGKETAKTAEVTEDFRTVCCAHAVLDELYRIIARIDIDAGILIGQLLSHNIPFLGKKEPSYCSALAVLEDILALARRLVAGCDGICIVETRIAHIVRLEVWNAFFQPA